MKFTCFLWSAFNALLKTLEEPPGHVIFILATTEPHKIPPTIISRCQRFEFRKISVNDIVERLSTVVTNEGTQVEGEALQIVARAAEGGMRDALVLLIRLYLIVMRLLRQKMYWRNRICFSAILRQFSRVHT